MKFKDAEWRTMTGFDLERVVAIAAEVHPNFPEDAEVLAERQLAYRDGAYFLEIGDRPAGYVLSHPWLFGDPPALNSRLGEIPASADTFYVHDLAILPVARRIGAASYILAALEKHARARRFATMSLVAVNQSQRFWERHGFAPLEIAGLADKLAGYEPAARLMVKPLA